MNSKHSICRFLEETDLAAKRDWLSCSKLIRIPKPWDMRWYFKVKLSNVEKQILVL